MTFPGQCLSSLNALTLLVGQQQCHGTQTGKRTVIIIPNGSHLLGYLAQPASQKLTVAAVNVYIKHKIQYNNQFTFITEATKC